MTSPTTTSNRAGTRTSAGKSGPLSSRWLRAVISVALLGVLVSFIDIDRTVDIVRSARPDLMLLVSALFLAQRVFAAYRWYILVHGKNPAITFARVVRLLFISDFVGFFGPGGVGYEVVRVYGLSRTTSDMSLSLSSVLVERFLALLALILLVLLGLGLSPRGLPPAIGYMAWLGLAMLGAGSVVVMHPRTRKMVECLLPGAWLAPVRRGLAKLYVCLDAYKEQPWLMAWAAILALGFQLLRVVIAVVGAWALGLDVSLLDFVVLMPVIIFVTLLPISIGGLGVREGGFVYLFGLVGMNPEAAFTLSLVISTLSIVMALPGAWLLSKVRSGQR